VVCNKAAARFMSVKVEDVLGKRIHEGFPGSEHMPLAGLFTRTVETGEGMSLGDVSYEDAVIPNSVFSIQTHPLPNRCVCVEFTNVTDQRKAEKLVSEQHVQLDQALQDLWGEMDLARKIQTVLLPGVVELAGYEFASQMRPAATVGGDYLDVVEVGQDTWLLIGDVSGHGVSAGLIMMMVQTAVRTAILGAAERGEEALPSAILHQVNSAIRGNLGKIGKDQYMTICAMRLRDGELTHAGLHLDMLVYRAATGAVEVVETDGVWLGVVDNAGPLLRDSSFRLQPGDYLLAHSDGLVELRLSPEPLGDGRLGQVFRKLAADHLPPGELVSSLMARLGVTELRDDATLMVLHRKGPGP
jgi:serine phosphatase RsbU (regulator of sigma subunit)